jgi:hypothetical protein
VASPHPRTDQGDAVSETCNCDYLLSVRNRLIVRLTEERNEARYQRARAEGRLAAVNELLDGNAAVSAAQIRAALNG